MMTRNSIIGLSLTVLTTLGLTSSGAYAQNIAAAKSTLLTATTSPVTTSVTSNPVVTEIISNNGTNSTFLVQDNTGAIEVYNLADTTYTPAVGDTISDSARIVSFHGLFELETSTAFSKTGVGTLPAQSVFTTTGLTNGSAVGQAQQSTIGTLSGVTFTGATGTFTSGGTYTVTDAFGSATVYVPSTDTGIIGQPIPAGVVSVTGYLGQYDTAVTSTGYGATAASTNGYELDPLSITAAPEPSSVAAMLIGAGLLGLVAVRRRRVA